MTRDQIAQVLREALPEALKTFTGWDKDCFEDAVGLVAVGNLAAALADRVAAIPGLTIVEPVGIDKPLDYEPDPEADGDDIPDEMRG